MKSILTLTNKSSIDTVPKFHENQDENIIYFSGENTSDNLAEYTQVLAQKNVDEIHKLIPLTSSYNKSVKYHFKRNSFLHFIL